MGERGLGTALKSSGMSLGFGFPVLRQSDKEGRPIVGNSWRGAGSSVVEQLPFKQRVAGSIPARPSNFSIA